MMRSTASSMSISILKGILGDNVNEIICSAHLGPCLQLFLLFFPFTLVSFTLHLSLHLFYILFSEPFLDIIRIFASTVSLKNLNNRFLITVSSTYEAAGSVRLGLQLGGVDLLSEILHHLIFVIIQCFPVVDSQAINKGPRYFIRGRQLLCRFYDMFCQLFGNNNFLVFKLNRCLCLLN